MTLFALSVTIIALFWTCKLRFFVSFFPFINYTLCPTLRCTTICMIIIDILSLPLSHKHLHSAYSIYIPVSLTTNCNYYIKYHDHGINHLRFDFKAVVLGKDTQIESEASVGQITGYLWIVRTSGNHPPIPRTWGHVEHSDLPPWSFHLRPFPS